MEGPAGRLVIRLTGDFGRSSSLNYNFGKGIKLDRGRYRFAFRVRGTPGRFDYLVFLCRQRGIYTVLTPIAWWPCHVGSRGFSSRFTMPQMTSRPEARQAQETYLQQFMRHVNSYTGRAYKDEPAVVAIELINEPLYEPETTVDEVRQYIDELAAAVRTTGAPQPIFYNGWSDKEEAVAQSSIEGCTFGWYPTGLVSGGRLRGNYLRVVDDYPRMRLPCLDRKAKIVYEFDAADVPGRVMYPPMARAFRSGGAQIACQFQYDPVSLAPTNYGWQTHYLNLVYAPGKALSFAIAAEVFRQTPRLARFGAYPANTTFGPFHIDFERDLSVLASEESFLHANATDVPPPAPEKLQRIAGCGCARRRLQAVLHTCGAGGTITVSGRRDLRLDRDFMAWTPTAR